MRERIGRLASFARDWAIGLGDLARAILPGRRSDHPAPGGACSRIPVVVLPGILENPRYLSPFTTWRDSASVPNVA